MRIEQDISITLPVNEWVVLLAAIEPFCVRAGMELKGMIAENRNPFADLTNLDSLIIAGPLIARAVIVKELIRHGHIIPDGITVRGTDKILELFRKHRESH